MKEDKPKNLAIVSNGADVVNVLDSFISAVTSEEPFFIVNLGTILHKFNLWNQHLPRVKPFYAVKCNNAETVLRMMADLGVGFDCASKNEIEQVLSLGVERSSIIYANPCKPNSHIKYATKVGVDLMTFDSVDELVKISQINANAKAILRIKSDAKKCPCVSLGEKYGVDPCQAHELLQAAQELGVCVAGVAFHVGSGCEDLTAYPRAIEHCRRVFDEGLSMGFPMEILDIGGGFPGTDDAAITFPQLARGIRSALEEHFPEDSSVQIIAEPGRYFATAAFTLSTTVIAKRQVVKDGQKHFMYYINDGIYSSFNCLLYDNAKVLPAVFKDGETHPSTIWGPTCDSTDKVVDLCHLPALDIGDRMYFENLGAYTVSAATTFNGFPKPKFYFYATAIDWNELNKRLSESTLETLKQVEEGSEDVSDQFDIWKEESAMLAKKLDQSAWSLPELVCAIDDSYALLAPFI